MQLNIECIGEPLKRIGTGRLLAVLDSTDRFLGDTGDCRQDGLRGVMLLTSITNPLSHFDSDAIGFTPELTGASLIQEASQDVSVDVNGVARLVVDLKRVAVARRSNCLGKKMSTQTIKLQLRQLDLPRQSIAEPQRNDILRHELGRAEEIGGKSFENLAHKFLVPAGIVRSCKGLHDESALDASCDTMKTRNGPLVFRRSHESTDRHRLTADEFRERVCVIGRKSLDNSMQIPDHDGRLLFGLRSGF